MKTNPTCFLRRIRSKVKLFKNRKIEKETSYDLQVPQKPNSVKNLLSLIGLYSVLSILIQRYIDAEI